MAATETRTFDTRRTRASTRTARAAGATTGTLTRLVPRTQSGSRGWRMAKRSFDLAFVFLALLALLPVLLVVALAIKLDTRGPLVFRQRRLGRDLRPFTVLKFRTMHHGASSDLHEQYIASLVSEASDSTADDGLKKLEADPRVTRVGAVLRRLSLDELPQLLNVLIGHMSLIGPRPALDYELDHYRPEHFERFRVRPGLSGLWQVSGRNEVGFMEMLDLDVEYTRTCTVLTDLRVFVRTPQAMVRGCA